MSFDGARWLKAINAYHRAQRAGENASESETHGLPGAEGAGARHCFGCGGAYAAGPAVWERFPDPANPYPLCPACAETQAVPHLDEWFAELDRRLILRSLIRNRLALVAAIAEKN